MRYGPGPEQRRSLRLQSYDYRQPGAYFVTACTRERAPLFGQVVSGEMRLNQVGEVVAKWWREIPNHFPYAGIDAFVVMPNHTHGIVVIVDPVGAGSPRPGPGPQPTDATGTETGAETAPLRLGPRHLTLGQIIAYLKYRSTKDINALRQTPGAPVWQRNYYEHVIRTEDDLNDIRQCVYSNPDQWATDEENPLRVEVGFRPGPDTTKQAGL